MQIWKENYKYLYTYFTWSLYSYKISNTHNFLKNFWNMIGDQNIYNTPQKVSYASIKLSWLQFK